MKFKNPFTLALACLLTFSTGKAFAQDYLEIDDSDENETTVVDSIPKPKLRKTYVIVDSLLKANVKLSVDEVRRFNKLNVDLSYTIDKDGIIQDAVLGGSFSAELDQKIIEVMNSGIQTFEKFVPKKKHSGIGIDNSGRLYIGSIIKEAEYTGGKNGLYDYIARDVLTPISQQIKKPLNGTLGLKVYLDENAEVTSVGIERSNIANESLDLIVEKVKTIKGWKPASRGNKNIKYAVDLRMHVATDANRVTVTPITGSKMITGGYINNYIDEQFRKEYPKTIDSPWRLWNKKIVYNISIDEKGDLVNIKQKKGINKEVDAAMLKIMKKQSWIPQTVDGKAMPADIVMTFRINSKGKMNFTTEVYQDFKNKGANYANYLKKAINANPILKELTLSTKSISFYLTIDARGSFVDVKIAKGVNEEVDKAMLEIYKNMPRCVVPARNGDVAVAVGAYDSVQFISYNDYK